MYKYLFVFTCLSIYAHAQSLTEEGLAQKYLKSTDSLMATKQYMQVLPTGKEGLRLFQERNFTDPISKAVLYSIIGTGFTFSEYQDSSLIYANRALELLPEREPDTLLTLKDTLQASGLIRSYTLLSEYHRRNNNQSKALQYMHRTLNIVIAMEGENSINVAKACHRIATIYYLFDQKKAIPYFEKARAGYKKANEIDLLINVTNSIGKAYSFLNQRAEALKNFNKALKLNREQNQNSLFWQFAIYTYIGNLYRLTKEYPKALEYLNKGLACGEKLESLSPDFFVELFGLLCGTHYAYGNKEEGDKFYFKLLKALHYSPDAPPALFSGYHIHDLKAAFELRMIGYWSFYKKTQNEIYLDTLQMMAEKVLILEEKSLEYAWEEPSFFFLGHTYYVYEHLLNLLLSEPRYDLEQAFKMVEQAKNRISIETLNLAKARQFAGLPKSLIAQEKAIGESIADRKQKLYKIQKGGSTNNADLIRKYQDSIFYLSQNRDELIAQLKEEAPKFYNLKYNPEFISIKNIQEQLQPEEGLLEYFVGDSSYYLFLILPDTAIVNVYPKDFPMHSWVQQIRSNLYDYWVKPGQPDSLFLANTKSYIQIAHQLYQKLIEPVSTYLPEKILIIPDDVLCFLPFDALITSMDPDNDDLTQQKYLILDHSISYDYSSSNHWQLKKSQKRHFSKFLGGFAPKFADQPISDSYTNRSVDELRSILTPLRYNSEEVRRIRTVVPGDLYLDQEASKVNFMEKADRYRVIHLATHSKADDQLGDYSFIAFTNTTADTNAIHDRLFVRDLYNLDLNADLVVLSACETGLGEIRRGEGVVSLARGFSYAGAKSTVTTLWNIQDHPTTVQFMESFYNKLKAGIPKDEALRAVKLETLVDPVTASPYFWAAFIPAGDMSAIDIPSSFNWWYVIIGMALLGGVVLWWFLRTKNQ